MNADQEKLDKLIERFVAGKTTPEEERQLATNPRDHEIARDLRDLRETLRALPPEERLERTLRDRPQLLERIATRGPLPETALSPAEALKRVRERALEQERRGQDPEHDHGPRH